MTNPRYLFMTTRNTIVAVERCADQAEARAIAAAYAVGVGCGVSFFVEVGHVDAPTGSDCYGRGAICPRCGKLRDGYRDVTPPDDWGSGEITLMWDGCECGGGR